jgi:hypothetical protein
MIGLLSWRALGRNAPKGHLPWMMILFDPFMAGGSFGLHRTEEVLKLSRFAAGGVPLRLRINVAKDS